MIPDPSRGNAWLMPSQPPAEQRGRRGPEGSRASSWKEPGAPNDQAAQSLWPALAREQNKRVSRGATDTQACLLQPPAHADSYTSLPPSRLLALGPLQCRQPVRVTLPLRSASCLRPETQGLFTSAPSWGRCGTGTQKLRLTITLRFLRTRPPGERDVRPLRALRPSLAPDSTRVSGYYGSATCQAPA